VNPNIASPEKDLIALVADKNIEAAIRGILNRPDSLGIRQITYDVYVHLHRDPGCLLESHTFLLPFSHNYRHSIVVFDREGCGHEHSLREELEVSVEDLVSSVGWNNRSAAIAIDPELESWVWKDSPHVSNTLGWGNNLQKLHTWLRENRFLSEDETRPIRPKEALEAALRVVRKPRSSAIYSTLAERVSLRKCTGPSFLKLRASLQNWFSRDLTIAIG
jgi:hypothetical protein